MSATFSALRGRAVLAQRLAGQRRPELTALALAATVEALGTSGWTDHGVRDIDLACVVGTAARPCDFDRRMRPLRRHLRRRWERVAVAMDTGRPLPPVRVIQLGELCFVVDGHHRVSVARARGASQIEATVTAQCTIAYACHCLTTTDLAHKDAERRFLERFPLPDETRRRLWLSDPNDWQRLAHVAEFRLRAGGSEHVENAYPPEDVARWWHTEVIPAVHRCRYDSTDIATDYLCATGRA